jgi:hypothetical protein
VSSLKLSYGQEAAPGGGLPQVAAGCKGARSGGRRCQPRQLLETARRDSQGYLAHLAVGARAADGVAPAERVRHTRVLDETLRGLLLVEEEAVNGAVQVAAEDAASVRRASEGHHVRASRVLVQRRGFVGPQLPHLPISATPARQPLRYPARGERMGGGGGGAVQRGYGESCGGWRLCRKPAEITSTAHVCPSRHHPTHTTP